MNTTPVTGIARFIEQDTALAQARKTDHLCMAPGCIECGNNTQIQMARNRLAAYVPQGRGHIPGSACDVVPIERPYGWCRTHHVGVGVERAAELGRRGFGADMVRAWVMKEARLGREICFHVAVGVPEFDASGCCSSCWRP